MLLSVERGRYYETNVIGGAIWRLLEEPSSVSGVVDHIATHYRVDRDRCSRDVMRFLAQLSDAQLILGVESALERGDETNAPAG